MSRVARGEVAALEPLMTLPELAELLRVPVATVYQWRLHGKGPKGYRVGRSVKFRLSEVEDWLQQQAS